MLKKFKWESKQNCTFFLHGDRWMIDIDQLTGKPMLRPNYNVHLGQSVRFTKSMKATFLKHKQEIEGALKL